MVRDLHYRQPIPIFQGRMRTLGMPPIRAEHLSPPGCARHASCVLEIIRQQPCEYERPTQSLGVGDVAGGINKALETCIRNGATIDLERWYRDELRRSLAIAGRSLAPIAAVAKYALRNYRHVAIVFAGSIGCYCGNRRTRENSRRACLGTTTAVEVVAHVNTGIVRTSGIAVPSYANIIAAALLPRHRCFGFS